MNPTIGSNAREHSFQRPVRNGKLSEILDKEFSRSYRFEGLADFVQDIKGLFRHIVDRRDRLETEASLKSTLENQSQENP
jgi:hypothetical protein